MISTILIAAALILEEPPSAPLAKFTAPEAMPAGRPILLDARESRGDAFQWWVQDSEGNPVQVAPVENGKVALLLAPKPGSYQVFLTANNKDQTRKHEAFRTVLVGGAPASPSPSTPPAVEPKAALIAPSFLLPGTAMVLDGRQSQGQVTWSIDGPRKDIVVTSAEKSPAGSLAILFNPPPGDYAVKLTARGTSGPDGQVVAKEAAAVVKVASSAPMAPTEEKPSPPKLNGYFHVTLIVDLNNIPPEYASLVSGEKIKSAQLPLGFSYWVRDYSAADFAHWNYKTYLEGFTDSTTGKSWQKVSVPALIIQDQDGRVISCDPAPTKPEDVVAKVGNLRKS